MFGGEVVLDTSHAEFASFGGAGAAGAGGRHDFRVMRELEPAANEGLVCGEHGAELGGEDALFGADLEAVDVGDEGGDEGKSEGMGEPEGPGNEGEEEAEIHGVARKGVDAGTDERGGSGRSEGIDGGAGAAELPDTGGTGGDTGSSEEEGEGIGCRERERKRGECVGKECHQ